MKLCLACNVPFEAPGWTCPSCGHAPARIGQAYVFASDVLDAVEAYESRFLDMLAQVEERHYWFRARRRIIVNALRRWFPNGPSYLELGCGSGYVVQGVTAAFPGWRIAASETLRSGLERAERRLPASVELYQIDLLRLPFVGEFDLIGAYDVIEHIEDHGAALRNFYKALRPGGGLLIAVPQHPWLWSAADDFSHHYRRYTRRELTGLATAAGFRVIATTSFNTMNLPLLLLRRFLDVDRPGMTAATIPVRPLNWLLERSMDLDGLLIQGGLRLPVGGSLLLAARRDS